MATAFMLGCAWFLTSHCSSALFEDQKSSNSWIVENIGDVSAVSLHSSAAVATVSAPGVVASLSLHDGSVRWRREEHHEGFIVSEEASTAIALRNDSLSAWHMPSGQLLWRHQQAVDAVCVAGSHLFLLVDRVVSSRTLPEGGTDWSVTTESGQGTHAACSATASQLELVRWTPGASIVHLVRINSAAASISDTRTLSCDHALGNKVLVTAVAVVALSSDGSHLCSAPLSGTGASLTCLQLPAPSATALLSAVGGSASLQHETALTLFSVHGAPAFVSEHKGFAVSSALFKVDEEVLTATAKMSADKVRLAIVSAASGKTLFQSSAVVQGAISGHSKPPTPIAAVWASPTRAAENDRTFKFFIRATDSTVMLVRDGEVAWTRHEALAHVERSLVLPLPPAGNSLAPPPRPPLSLFGHLTLNLLQLKAQLGLADAQDATRIAALKQEASERESGTRDLAGIRQQAVLATKSGQLFSLLTTSGSVLWRAQLESQGMRLLTLAVARLPHNEEEDTEMVAIYSSDNSAVAIRINAHSGAVIRTDKLPSAVTHCQEVEELSNHERVFLLAALHPTLVEAPVFVYPPSAALPSGSPLHLWAADEASGALAGYVVAQPSGGQPHARQTWSLTADGPLLAVQKYDGGAQTASHVKVQGDRSMRFRFLNANLALVASGAPDQAAAEEDGVTAMIVDTITGRIVHQQHFNGACGPVTAALFDNQAALQFWDARAFRWHFASLEMYEHAVPVPPPLEMVTGAVTGRLSQERTTTSHIPVTVEVLTASFFSKIGIRSMVPTATRHSVTPKHLLMATVSDQLYDMDAKYVDARRPKVAKPTAAHMEERLIPYSPQLPLSPQSFASFDHQIANIHSVRSYPTEMESTTHVLAWGSDVYYVLLRPALGFDMLSGEFSFALLTVALLGLGGSVVVMSRLVSEAKLKHKWK